MSDKLNIEIDLDIDDLVDLDDTVEVEEDEVNEAYSNESQQVDTTNDEKEENKTLLSDLKSIIGKKNTKYIDPNEEYKLFLLMDNKVEQVTRWLNSIGIYATYVSDEIKEFADTLGTSYGKCVALIVDTGVGEFNSMDNAKKLIDLLGMDIFEDKHFFMLYSDDTIKVDTRAKLGRNNIQWIQYKGSKDIYNLIKKNGIKIASKEPYEIEIDNSESLNYRAKSLDLYGEETEFKGIDLSTSEKAYELFQDKDRESVDGFKVVI